MSGVMLKPKMEIRKHVKVIDDMRGWGWCSRGCLLCSAGLLLCLSVVLIRPLCGDWKGVVKRDIVRLLVCACSYESQGNLSWWELSTPKENLKGSANLIDSQAYFWQNVEVNQGFMLQPTFRLTERTHGWKESTGHANLLAKMINTRQVTDKSQFSSFSVQL